MSEPNPNPLITLDMNLAGNFRTGGTAYFRISPEMRDFLQICDDKHGIVGFEWDGTMNFGVILKEGVYEPKKAEHTDKV